MNSKGIYRGIGQSSKRTTRILPKTFLNVGITQTTMLGFKIIWRALAETARAQKTELVLTAIFVTEIYVLWHTVCDSFRYTLGMC